MTTYGAAIVALLTADAVLMNILQGGVYEFQDTGRKGLTRIETMQAFQQETGLLKPTGIIYETQGTPTYEAIDLSVGYASTVTPIVGWIYDDGDAGYDTIDLAERRIYTLLQGQQIPNAFQIIWTNTIRNRRDPLLSNACCYQFFCKVHGFRSNT